MSVERTEEERLLNQETVDLNDIKSKLDVEQDRIEREKYIEEINNKQNQIFKLKETMYETRFKSELPLKEKKELLKKQFEELNNLEEELKLLRKQCYDAFNKSLKLDALQLSIPEPSAPKRPVSSLSLERKEKAMQSWGKALRVVTAANKWKRKWETQQQKETESILRATEPTSPGAEMTKEQILQLRRTVYRLKQKKQLTPKETFLLQSATERLKQLDKKYILKKKQEEEEKKI